MSYRDLIFPTLILFTYSVVIVLGGHYFVYHNLDRPFWSPEAGGVYGFQILITFLPFGIWQLIWLVLVKSKTRWAASGAYYFPIGIGFAISLLSWGYYYFDAVTRTEGGANIGLGLWLLFSPMIITLIMLTAWITWKLVLSRLL